MLNIGRQLSFQLYFNGTTSRTFLGILAVALMSLIQGMLEQASRNLSGTEPCLDYFFLMAPVIARLLFEQWDCNVQFLLFAGCGEARPAEASSGGRRQLSCLINQLLVSVELFSGGKHLSSRSQFWLLALVNQHQKTCTREDCACRSSALRSQSPLLELIPGLNLAKSDSCVSQYYQIRADELRSELARVKTTSFPFYLSFQLIKIQSYLGLEKSSIAEMFRVK